MAQATPHNGNGHVRTIVSVRSCDCGIQGPENLILTLAEALGRQNVRYIIVNLWDGVPPTVELHEEAVRRGLESHVVATSWDYDPAILSKLAVLLQRLKPDVIHTHDFKSDMTVLAVNSLVRAPIITSFYGRLTFNSLFVKTQDRVRLLTFRLFKRVLANSSMQRKELQRWRVPERLIESLPSFVDTRTIRPPSAEERQAARARLELTPEQPVLATVARLAPNKGHRYIIEALAEVRKHYPDVCYLVSGEGSMAWRGDGGLTGELVDYVKSLDLMDNVRFLGYYPDLRTVLHATDMLVSPSLLEGMQVSLLEAMAAGRPIVATAIGGTPDAVVDGETGLLVPPADALALQKAVLELLNDRERMRRLGEQGRRRVEELFDVQVVANQVLQICEGVAGQQTAAYRTA